jgi:hypothetical protein
VASTPGVELSSESVLSLEEGLRRLQPSEARRLKQPKDENAKLKRLVAELTLDKTMLHCSVFLGDGSAVQAAALQYIGHSPSANAVCGVGSYRH